MPDGAKLHVPVVKPRGVLLLFTSVGRVTAAFLTLAVAGVLNTGCESTPGASGEPTPVNDSQTGKVKELLSDPRR